MSNEAKFHEIGQNIESAESGKLFGKPCFKLNGKAFLCFFEDEMVFKLDESSRDMALAIRGSKLFDPSKKGRPMKEWVRISASQIKDWENWAKKSSMYIIKLTTV